MEQEIRYCTTEDGVRIGYCVRGEGPALVVCPELVESFALENLVPERKAFVDELGRGQRVVRYDTRGTGLSQRQVGDVSLPALVRDIEAVVAAAGLERFSIYATLAGGPRAMAYAAKNPGQVHRLVLFGTFLRVADVMREEDLTIFAELARSNWHVAAETIANLRGRRQIPESNARLAEQYRQSTSGDLLARLFLSNYDADVTAFLPTLEAKTIVVHYIKDDVIPFATAQTMAALIPDALLVPLDDSAPYPEALLAAARAFLEQAYDKEAVARAAATPHPGLRTVLFTDMEDSVAVTQRLGDDKAREVLRTHNAIVREALKTHGGSEIKPTGDGIMASFPSASRALECAVAVQRALASHNVQHPDAPIQVRISLNAGEPLVEEHDLVGTAVQLARRICDLGEPGQILASNVVRELAAGKGFRFTAREEVLLKGFDEPVRLYEVQWRAPAPVYPAGLTMRQVEVLRLIAAGNSNREIADELVISLNTVARHVSNIFAKTGVVNRAEAATYAAQHRLLSS